MIQKPELIAGIDQWAFWLLWYLGLEQTLQCAYRSINNQLIIIIIFIIIINCAVPENIYTHPMEDHWKFWWGSQTLNFLKESMQLNWKFHRGGGGGGGKPQKTFLGGMDIFWNRHWNNT